MAKAWSKVSPSERDTHFFATLDFEDNLELFKKVIYYSHVKMSDSTRD